MATFLKPSEIQKAYLAILQALKPSLNVNDPNSDFVIRGKAFSGLVSGIYGDQESINKDTFVSTARFAALLLKGQDLGIDLQSATAAKGSVKLTGTVGAAVPTGLQLIYAPTGCIYLVSTAGATIGIDGTATVSVQCSSTGQIGNVAYPDSLTVVSPPSGIGSVAALVSDLSDGADVESTDSYRARLLSRERQAPAGGNETDYVNYAFAADPAVRSALPVRFALGLGTVSVYITSGTTDINTAVTQGQAIIRIPSAALIASVQEYYNAHVPLTDCPKIIAPTQINVPVTVQVVAASGLTLDSVPSDPIYNPLGLTVRQLVQREVSRVLYKLPVGGRSIPGEPLGMVVASDIEAGLSTWLSAVTDTVSSAQIGKLPVLADFEVQPLNGPHYNLPIGQSQIAAPGTITVIAGVP